jgi:acyl-coenzyme A thioesterase PaaI-like protein
LPITRIKRRSVDIEGVVGFDKQGMMKILGATLGKISSGAIEIELRPSPAIAQQHGFVHAGAITAIADNACGFSALSLMPEGTRVLTTEFKLNLVAIARFFRASAFSRG